MMLFQYTYSVYVCVSMHVTVCIVVAHRHGIAGIFPIHELHFHRDVAG